MNNEKRRDIVAAVSHAKYDEQLHGIAKDIAKATREAASSGHPTAESTTIDKRFVDASTRAKVSASASSLYLAAYRGVDVLKKAGVLLGNGALVVTLPVSYAVPKGKTTVDIEPVQGDDLYNSIGAFVKVVEEANVFANKLYKKLLTYSSAYDLVKEYPEFGGFFSKEEKEYVPVQIPDDVLEYVKKAITAREEK